MFGISRRWWLAAAAAVLVMAGALWLLWPKQSAPRARQYLNVDACLLTDAQGIAGAQAAPVWAGMQDASLSSHARVSYLQVIGAATPANAQTYLNSLIQRHCAVVLALGPAQVASVAASAAKYPKVRFVVIGGQATGPNVTYIDGSSDTAVRSAVSASVSSVVHSANR